MKPRTSPLRTALAGLCGPSGRDQASADGLLAVAGLQLQAYDPPASFADPRLEALCREAARRGLVITDGQGRLVGDLRAVSVNEVLPAFDALDGTPFRVAAPTPTHRELEAPPELFVGAALAAAGRSRAKVWMIVPTILSAFEGLAT